jgi:hypothetical protein
VGKELSTVVLKLSGRPLPTIIAARNSTALPAQINRFSPPFAPFGLASSIKCRNFGARGRKLSSFQGDALNQGLDANLLRSRRFCSEMAILASPLLTSRPPFAKFCTVSARNRGNGGLSALSVWWIEHFARLRSRPRAAQWVAAAVGCIFCKRPNVADISDKGLHK